MDAGNGLCVIGRAERMGLGSMTQDFCRAFYPDRVVLLTRNSDRALPPGSIPAKEVVTLPYHDFRSSFRRILSGIHTVVGFETWYDDEFPKYATSRLVGTVMFPMWEWSPDSVNLSSVLITLSETDSAHYSNGLSAWWPPSPEVHDPRRLLNWPPQTFVHLAGNASHNREGTKEVLEAAKYLRGTDARLVVYSSFNVVTTFGVLDPESPVELRGPVPHRKQLFDGCDILVQPRRLPGHSLPINEALGEDIPVITLDMLDWRQYAPYRVTAHAQPREKFGRGFCDVWKANPDYLGDLMRRMAIGKVSRVPGPVLPSWEAFREWWEGEVQPRANLARESGPMSSIGDRNPPG